MPDSQPILTIGTTPVRISDVLAVAAGRATIRLDESPAFQQMLQGSVDLLDKLIASGASVYGVTTGFGANCETAVPPGLSAQMAANLVRFHGVGTGRFLDETETAAVMVVRLVSLSQGRSGVRPMLLTRLCELLNRRILPRIPAEGSVGASGDLTPLSYIAAVLIGEREVMIGVRGSGFRVQGVDSDAPHFPEPRTLNPEPQIQPAATALKAAGLLPIELRPKESLALMNGTSVMTGLACLAYDRAKKLGRWAAAITAMASDVLHGNRAHFDERLFAAKPHAGQLACARWIAADIEYTRGAQHSGRIQDRYSVRCAPHVIGVLLDALPFIAGLLETEINSSNDNPLLDPATGDVLHGGNFYGGHPCMAMDLLKTAVANVADLIDRQMALVCNPHYNHGLPADLVAKAGDDQVSHHGFKAMQITASALTAEALKLTMPASVFSRSTESHNQDKVSMGTIASRDALRVIELTETVLAVVQLAMCQAVDLREKGNCHARSLAIHAAVRRVIPMIDDDRRQDGDIQKVLELFRRGSLPIGEADFPA